jgi:transmembrane sensor
MRNDCLIAQLILDQSFQRYVIQSTIEDTQIWEAWLAENSNSSDTFKEAKEIIIFISTRKILPQNTSISEEVFSKLQAQISSESARTSKPKKAAISYYWFAASVIFLIGIFIMYEYSKAPKSIFATNQELQVIVPNGQRSQLVLPDGTKVWLNSGSTFRYPNNFLSQVREVYLEGEAFFNVTHKGNKPFIVHLKDNLEVKVVGTEFNVKCYEDDKTIETTLVKGIVDFQKRNGLNRVIEEVRLNPKEKVTYSKSIQRMVVTKLINSPNISSTLPLAQVNKTIKPEEKTDEIELITSWKDDALVFQDETLDDITLKMERWFGIPISIKDSTLGQERFTGKFVNKESIYQILDIINRSEPIEYSKIKDGIIISKKRGH